MHSYVYISKYEYSIFGTIFVLVPATGVGQVTIAEKKEIAKLIDYI